MSITDRARHGEVATDFTNAQNARFGDAFGQLILEVEVLRRSVHVR